MSKQINYEWMNELLTEKSMRNEERDNNLPDIDWATNGRAFKKDLMFKLIPANSKENNIFAYIVGTHWNLGPENKRFICPEKTLHLKKLGIECPVCAAKRKLLAKGFTEEDLSIQGKFGPVPVFDPTMTSNVKVVVTASDLKSDWDKAHISVLQQKGEFLTKWLARKYKESDTPDLLLWESSNLIKFSRPTENGKWERELSFATFNPTPEVVEKLKAENEALVLPDLWKAPTDQDIFEVRAIVADMVTQYENAKKAITESASSMIDNDDLPF